MHTAAQLFFFSRIAILRNGWPDVETLPRDPKSLSKAEQLWRKRWRNRNHNGETQHVAGKGADHEVAGRNGNGS